MRHDYVTSGTTVPAVAILISSVLAPKMQMCTRVGKRCKHCLHEVHAPVLRYLMGQFCGPVCVNIQA